METIVELRAAKIPGIIGYIALHYWFVVIKDQQKDRWEIWQNPNLCNHSWGHLHKNLMNYSNGVGNGNSWIEKTWRDQIAIDLANIIESSPTNYRYNHHYCYYPGPNSNTYVQWVLNQGNIDHLLSKKGIGKNYYQGKICNNIFSNISSMVMKSIKF
jgi:hypothetical protein